MLTHMHPSQTWFACKTSSFMKGSGPPSSVSGPVPEPPSAQSPFARLGYYLRRRDVQHLVRGRYPSFIAHTDSCARPNSSGQLRISLFRPVFAGCRQPLLEDGPSRRYLHNLCEGAWTHTPQRSLVLSVWSPCHRQRSTGYQGHRPRLRVQGLGTPNDPCNATSTGDGISGLQSFANVQAPSLARPSGCTYHCAQAQGSRAVYITQ